MRVIDLFAGCGGLTLGLENAGFDVVLGVDNWLPAVRMYKANFKHPMLDLDLLDVKNSVKVMSKYRPDMIVGGPPCQDYSSAGKRNEEHGRADLTISFAEIVRQMRPKFFIMENVDRIVKAKRYKEALETFKDCGYGITAITLDASLCGAPQKRKRHFIIGSIDDADDFLLEIIKKNLSIKPTTIRDYLGDKLGTEHYYRHPRNYNRRGIFSIDEPSATIRGVNRPLPAGYPGHHNDSTKDYTLVRPLTSKERSYIQTFPENFQLIGNKGEIEQAIGNAVPVKLAEYVANCLNEYLSITPDTQADKVFEPRVEAIQLAV
jgi:DNA (cytosine-5)-methyltransferase 1